MLLEPVLGEGGVSPLDRDYLALARRLCTERGALLVLDEVQTVVGRTGEWFAFQGRGIEPDVFILAKGLANGLPIGACLSREEVAFGPGDHASTFGGGPVPCAGALAVLAEGGIPGVTEVRGAGLLVGVAFEDARAGQVVRALIERGFLATEAEQDVVRVSPPLNVTEEDVAAFVAAFPDAAAAAAEGPP